ncbi:MAG: hypothetical protein KDK06_16840 [Gammaproteobacteria bacterium]|nr:hypothetical protein [Gammaproteobacteria bacterium]
MNPDIDLRLKSLEKALGDVILRAIPEHERLARDQVNLVLGHLGIIARHWKYALRYELDTLAGLHALAGRLRPFADDLALVQALDTARGAAEAVDRADYDAVSAAQRTLGAAIDRVIAADYTTAPMPPAMRDIVLDYFATQAPRERTWHQGSGLDPDAAGLPAIESLFGRGRR